MGPRPTGWRRHDMAERDLDDDAAPDGADQGQPARVPGGGRPDRAAAARLAACSSRGGTRRRRRGRGGRHGGRASAAAAPPPAAARSRRSCSCTTGATTSRPTTSRRSRREFGVENVHVRHLRQQRGADRQAPGRRVGLRHRRPTAEYVPGHGRGRVPRRSSTCRGSRTSQYINPTFKGLWWDPNNEYQVPKDYGTTGIL